jgi:hypothetical protein
MGRKSTNERRRVYEGLARGIEQLWMSGGPVHVASKQWPPQQLVDALRSIVDAIVAQDGAYRAYQKKVAQRRALEKKWKPLVVALKGKALVTHWNDPVALGAFALSQPKKSGPKTAAVKAAAAGKGKATQERRAAARKKLKGR